MSNVLALNLTAGFNPIKGVTALHYTKHIFNGGEPHIKLDMGCFGGKPHTVIATSRLKTSDDLMTLLIAVDALKLSGYLDTLELVLPYFPGARQDRVCVPGEALTSRVYTNIINDLGATAVTIFDLHSDVVPALLHTSFNRNNHSLVDEAIYRIHGDALPHEFHLVAPDAGANKKISSLSKYLASNRYVFDVVKCDKSRDITTGDLTGFEVYYEDLGGKDCIIVDDICDGGGTFVGLAKELRAKNAGNLYLIVSHGIFSKGFKELKKHFKAIYTTDSWCNNYAMEIPEIEKGSEIVNIIKLKELNLYED